MTLAVLVPGSSPVAWGGPGHMAVAAIAEDRLTPQARAMVREIAGAVPISSPEICTWADSHRNPATGRWHYVNIPLSAEHFDDARDCPRGACAVAEIERATAELARSAEPEGRLKALRWLVHAVGDLHQPFHAGDGWDRGGNDLRVRFGRRKQPTNLHKVWDVDLVKPLVRDLGPLGLARMLEQRIRPSDAAAWAADLAPRSWADESHREARAIYAELGVSPTERGIVQLPRDYASQERWRVEAAMQRAGVHLGAVLNQVARERAGGPTAAVEVGR